MIYNKCTPISRNVNEMKYNGKEGNLSNFLIVKHRWQKKKIEPKGFMKTKAAKKCSIGGLNVDYGRFLIDNSR